MVLFQTKTCVILVLLGHIIGSKGGLRVSGSDRTCPVHRPSSPPRLQRQALRGMGFQGRTQYPIHGAGEHLMAPK